MDRAGEERALRAALERGYLSAEQVARAQAEAQGQPLLPILAARYLTSPQVTELRALLAGPSGPRGEAPRAPSPPPALGATPGLGGGFGLSPAPAAQAPARLGPYLLEEELGRGGMGAVYRARHVELGRVVALKTLLGESPRALARFRTEAEAMARLNHPNVVRIHEVGEDQGRCYLAMQLVEGESLWARVLRAGPLSPREAADAIAQAALGVSAAHGAGFLHRDLKPENLLAHPDGRVLVTDFGLAKDTSSHQDLTRTGQVLGTVAFMPPEQARGQAEAVDERSDVYGLGASLFALLSGAAPFSGDSPVSVLAAVMRGPIPRLQEFDPQIDPRLAAICERCLAKDSAQRFQSAAELAEVLQAWLGSKEFAPGRPRWRLAWVGLGVALCAGVALAGALRAPPAAPTPSPSEARPAPSRSQRREGVPEVSRAQLRAWLSEPRLRVDHLEGRGITLDGDRIVTWGQGVRVWDVESGALHATWAGRDIFGLVASPEGYTFGGREGVIYRWERGAEEPRELVRLGKEPLSEFALGEGVLGVAQGRTALVVDLASGELRQRLEGHGEELRGVAFSSQGLIATCCGIPLDETEHASEHAVRLWDAKTGALLLRRSLVAMPHAIAFEPAGDRFALAAEGTRLLLYSRAGERLRAFEGEGASGPLTPISAHRGVVRALAFDPSGRFLVSVSATHGFRKNNEIRLWEVESGRELLWIRGRAATPWSVAFAAGGRVVVGTRGGAEVWELRGIPELAPD